MTGQEPGAQLGRTEATPPEVLPESDRQETEEATSSDESDGDGEDKSEDDRMSAVTEPENWIRFSFGPDWAFCLWTRRGARWNIRGQSAAIDAWRGLKLDKVFRVTWTVDGGWIVTGETKDNAPLVAYWHVKSGTVAVENAKRWAERHDGYEKLFNTVRNETAGDMDKVRRASWSVGPGGCWWMKIGDSILQHDLPQALELMMEKKEREGVRTEHVALGMYGSYVAFWSDGTRTWSLQGYDVLHEYLQGDGEYVYVALSPVRNDNYFLVRKNGCTIWNVYSWDDSTAEIHTMTNAYMQTRAHSDGTTFDFTYTGERADKNRRR